MTCFQPSTPGIKSRQKNLLYSFLANTKEYSLFNCFMNNRLMEQEVNSI